MKLIKGELIKLRFKLSHVSRPIYSEPFEVLLGEGIKNLLILNNFLKKSDSLTIDIINREESPGEYLISLEYNLKSGKSIKMEPARYKIMDKYKSFATKLLTDKYKSQLTVEVLTS